MKLATYSITLLLFLFLFTGSIQKSYCQEKEKSGKSDSSLILRPGMDTSALENNAQNIKVDSATVNSPKVATYLSAALPGLGQIYNKNYWKLPIIYGAAAVLGYYISWNNNKYHQYLNLLFDSQNNIPNLQLTPGTSVDEIKNGVDYYRRNRDYDMIVMAGLYLMQIVDAQVQAQLMNFNLSPDLSMRFTPVINESALMTRSVGFGIVITLN